jgi:hypothetical protein
MNKTRVSSATVNPGVAFIASAVLGLAAVIWSGTSRAQDVEELKQIELSEKQVAGFIAAQTDLQPLSAKLLEGGDRPDDALKGELDNIAKKHGFANFDDMEIVGANISIVLDGLDPKTGDYTDPVEKMKLELENIKADASIPEDDRKLVIEDLNQEIAAAKPLQFQSNIEVVKKFQPDLEKLTVDSTGESAPEGGAPADGDAKPDDKK